jgi:L-lactate dehydrogenase
MPRQISRVAIIGVGQVGAAVGYTLILGFVVDEILLVDIRAEWRDGQVRDLTDVAYAHGSRTRVHAADYHEASQCDIVVITAGSKFSYGTYVRVGTHGSAVAGMYMPIEWQHMLKFA